MTEQPRNEFLPKPRWRTHARPRRLALAIGVTFTSVLAFGLVLLFLIIGLISWLDAPPLVSLLLWIGLTIGTIVWALAAKSPATSSEMEYQPWSEFAVRFVMIGNEHARAPGLRIVTGLIFGAPVGIYRVAVGLAVVTGLL